jgi:hypothetical protein
MSQPNEQDEISRALDTIVGQYFAPPAEMDLRGVDPATFALGICYGFDSWRHVRVVANNRRDVATAAGTGTSTTPRGFRAMPSDDEQALTPTVLGARPAAQWGAQLLRLSATLDQVDPDRRPTPSTRAVAGIPASG